MQRHPDGTLVVSAPPISSASSSATTSSRSSSCARPGALEKPVRDDPELELLRKRGYDHEQAYLARLRPTDARSTRSQLRDAEHARRAARGAGRDARGDAPRRRRHLPGDVLRRPLARPCGLPGPPRRSAVGPRGVELRRRRHQARPAGEGGGDRPDVRLRGPARAGSRASRRRRSRSSPATGRRTPHRLADYAAYYRAAKRRFEERVFATAPRGPARDVPRAGRPLPGLLLVDPCAIDRRRDGRPPLARRGRRARPAAEARRRRRDDARRRWPSLPADRGDPRDLEPADPRAAAPAGRAPARESADARPPLRADPAEPGGVRPGARARCRHPARSTSSSTSRPTRGRSTTASSTSSAGPRRCDGEPVFHADLGARPRGEKASSRQFVDLVMERLARDPGMHVYHYGGYESGALKRLMQRHATREDEVDRLLRGQRPRRPLRPRRPPGHPGDRRVVLDQEDREVLHARARGRDHRRPASASSSTSAGWRPATRRSSTRSPPTTATTASRPAAARLARGAPRRGALRWYPTAIVPRPEPADGGPAGGPRGRAGGDASPRGRAPRGAPRGPARARRRRSRRRWLLAGLLDWHRREAKPQWWDYYRLVEASLDDLVARRRPRWAASRSSRTAGAEQEVAHPPLPVRPGAGHARSARARPSIALATGRGRLGQSTGDRGRVDPLAGTIDLKRNAGEPAPGRADPGQAVRRRADARGAAAALPTTSSPAGSTRPTGRTARPGTCAAPPAADRAAWSRARRSRRTARRRSPRRAGSPCASTTTSCRSRDRPGPARPTPGRG